MSFESFREQFPPTRSWAYLDTANTGLIPETARKTFSDWLDDYSVSGGASAAGTSVIEDVRHEFAALLGGKPDEYSMIRNTTEGINIAANGLRLRAGDNIVLSELEHPANGLAWRRLEKHGVELRMIRSTGQAPSVDDYVSRIDHRTCAVAISWVFFGHGARIDLPLLAQACRKKGALLIVDAIQGAGALNQPLESLGADVVTAGAHKFLFAGLTGTGFLWIRAASLDRIAPTFIGRFGYQHDNWAVSELCALEGTRRFEYGNYNNAGFAILLSALREVRALGLAAVEAHTHMLTERLIQSATARKLICLTPTAWNERAGLVTLALPACRSKVMRAFAVESVIATVRKLEVRASVAAYNNCDDIDHFCDVLGSVAD